MKLSTNNFVAKWRSHIDWTGVILFALSFVACFIGFYLRYRNNFQFPNFFAEDGTIFTKNLLDHGFLSSLATTFNGYYVWGLYVINKIALILNAIVYHGTFATIPKAIAITSYAFLAFCATVPILVFRRYIKLPFLIVLTALLVLVPMPGNSYAIIGALGSLKFAFVYLAFLLLVLRLRQKRTSRWIPVIDLGIVLCAYTTSTTYLLLPIILWQDGLRPKDWLTRNWRQYIQGNIALWSTLVLGLVLLGQVWIIATQGLPKLPGYLDQPLNYHRLVEIFAGRSYLYGFTQLFYHALRDWSAVLLLGILCLLASLKAARTNRQLYWFAFYSVGITTLLLITNRTGISAFFTGYDGRGPIDQFFYGQNLIFDVAFIALLATLVDSFTKKRWHQLAAAGVLLLLTVAPLLSTTSFRQSSPIQPGIQPLPQMLNQACALYDDPVAITVYPVSSFIMIEPRSLACQGRRY